MKSPYVARRYSFCVCLICLFTATCSGPSDDSAGTQPSGARGIPRLLKQGAATQIVADGEPYLILGGELHNFSSSSLEYMKPIWPKLAQMNLFIAWHYARYIDAVVQARKKQYPIPMFVNPALIRTNYHPGRYNSGSPLPHLFDIWKVACPHIDFFAPDI
jgi:hypothetical protein